MTVHQRKPVPSTNVDGLGELHDHVLLDVREPNEWEAGHAPDAWFWPLSKLDGVRAELPLDRAIVCICRSGHRSANATELLRSWGLEAFNFEGGMQAWSAAGRPVVRDDDTPGTVI